MTIDAKAAEGLAKWAHAQAAQIRSAATSMSPDRDTADRLEALGKLASAHAVTLPREVEDWVIMDSVGRIKTNKLGSEGLAIAHMIKHYPHDHQVVRLTGTAVIKPEV